MRRASQGAALLPAANCFPCQSQPSSSWGADSFWREKLLSVPGVADAQQGARVTSWWARQYHLNALNDRAANKPIDLKERNDDCSATE
jgi:hypothetical protein